MMVRPYKQPSSGPTAKDMLLGPVRLLQALGGFLNLFSMRYGGKPLHSGGAAPAQAKEKSERELFIEGNLIQAERNLKENQRRGEANPGIVSGAWRLVRLKARRDVGNRQARRFGLRAASLRRVRVRQRKIRDRLRRGGKGNGAAQGRTRHAAGRPARGSGINAFQKFDALPDPVRCRFPHLGVNSHLQPSRLLFVLIPMRLQG